MRTLYVYCNTVVWTLTTDFKEVASSEFYYLEFNEETQKDKQVLQWGSRE